MQVAIGHKGKAALRAVCHGQSGHSALAPLFVNALHLATDLVHELRRLQQDLAAHGARDPAYRVPHATIHVGTLTGGSALNIVPHECVFDFEFRHLPGDDPEALLREFTSYVKEKLEPEMQAVHPQAGFEIGFLSEIPALDTGMETGVVGLAHELSGCSDIGKVSYGTEAAYFHKAGIPAVVCGPGSIAVAHKPDEHVSEAQLAQCDRMLERLVERLSA
jgi:acetylornithine deacetylase